LVPADEVNPQNLGLHLRINGVQRQNSNTDNMIFPWTTSSGILSQFMVLEPGDVVNTGTPHGVARACPTSRTCARAT